MSERGLAGLDPCVHCGFCLQSCPTYRATGDEADSPRGRIVLIKGLLQGSIRPQEDRLAYHLDRCLGCRACESSCPSGVSYGPALEQARSVLSEARPVPGAARIVNAVMSDRRLWRPVFGMAKLMRPMARRLAGGSSLGFVMAMLGATRQLEVSDNGRREPEGAAQRPRLTTQPVDDRPPSASLFTGCIMDGLFSHVHRATERTLIAHNISMIPVRSQGCCGALHAHSGQHEKARELARHNVRAFAAHPDVPVVVNSAGCGAILKEYGELLSGDSLQGEALEFSRRVQDVSEVLARLSPRRGAPIRIRVAYDPPCHLLHAQRVADPPLQLLQSIPEIELVGHRDSDQCCGSAGSYSLTESVLSRLVLDCKVKDLIDAGPDVVASGNPGCIMQIGAGLRAAGSTIPVVHPIEVLDLSYRRAGFYDS